MESPSKQTRYDVVVVGGGHNGLVAAAYLARAGRSVLVLERLPRTGGAVATEELFSGLPVKASPYAYLVGLLPDRIVSDLGLDVQLAPRRTRSYAPVIRGGRHAGLMVESSPTHLTSDSFQTVTGSDQEHEAWRTLRRQLADLSSVIAPSMLEPLVTRRAMQQRLDAAVWSDVVERPIGAMIEERFSDDVVRGLVATDALFGTFADLHDPELQQNLTFLYRQLAQGSDQWRVPVGGMGALSSSLERAVARHGGEVVTDAFVSRLDTDGAEVEVTYQHGDAEHRVAAAHVLCNVSPWVLQLLMGENPGPRPEGSQIKLTMVLERLPRLRSGVSGSLAFNGTVHTGQSYDQLQQSFLEAQIGELPESPPGELVCHSLADPSVLGPLAMEGKHVFSYLGLNAPARLFSGHVNTQRDELTVRILDVINLYLEEPIESLISLDAEGNPCLQALAPQDIETRLAMPGGHMYHGPLSWPWLADRAAAETPAQRWGVSTSERNIFLCGSGAVRGGAVSGIGGHNAAMALLETHSS